MAGVGRGLEVANHGRAQPEVNLMAVKIVVYPYRPVPPRRHVPGPRGLGALLLPALLLFLALLLPILAAGNAGAATPCDQATLPGQCA